MVRSRLVLSYAQHRLKAEHRPLYLRMELFYASKALGQREPVGATP